MQLCRKYKHLWFVFLMIFFIGGSGVAVAVVQAIQSDQKSYITTQKMPCHEQHMMDQHHHMSNSHVDMKSLTKCHDGKMHNDQYCQDCNSPSHCQAVNLALDQQAPSLSYSPFLEPDSYKNTDYQARHLAGYWQEILRPPRT
ncbi:hypothetical protein QTA56_06005 [Acinetobacter sp. VNH17]|uniref:DUF2946 domain-containing protein n=1 Tax=Acinetobacter thutiue TaxID=2998078 RepID=A0ABT7WM85_9GAMM|nr:hypothetical protein [Acinetobacter thutiue]MCY6411695.1 hypothetical protein [Acinetobacter thutiue]MDN0013797.1 hypothetical protein [Acinetobacter thutiue]